MSHPQPEPMYGVCALCANRRYVTRRIGGTASDLSKVRRPCPLCNPTDSRKGAATVTARPNGTAATIERLRNYARVRYLREPGCRHRRVLYLDFFGPVQEVCLDCGRDV